MRRRLSKRQIERIQQIQERRRQNAAARADAQLALADGEPRAGTVVSRHGANLAVADNRGEVHHCLLRQNLGEVVAGDHVVWHPSGDAGGVVTAVEPRRALLTRPNASGHLKPLAANLTQLVVVIAPEPAPSGYLVDQYLAAAELNGLGTIIAINKSDLLGTVTPEALQRMDRYADIGYPLVTSSTKTADGVKQLEKRLKAQNSILVGQSGVGKSSLVKALLPDRDIQVGQISQATGLGRHTTTTATLYQLAGGGTLIDSPGVRSFRLPPMTPMALAEGFREFHPYLGKCRFSNCSHGGENGCALRAAVAAGKVPGWRLESYLHMAERLASE
ncbi:MAG: ribosome small subunit-dependent GTPase A [Pseudomonadota bacterium]